MVVNLSGPSLGGALIVPPGVFRRTGTPSAMISSGDCSSRMDVGVARGNATLRLIDSNDGVMGWDNYKVWFDAHIVVSQAIGVPTVIIR